MPHKPPQNEATHIPPYPLFPPHIHYQNKPLNGQTQASMIFYPDSNCSESMNNENYAPFFHEDDAVIGDSVDTLFGGVCELDNVDDVGDASLPSINSLLSTAVQMF